MVEDESTWQATASFQTLQKRAQVLHDIRAFFNQRNVTEVETPLLSEFCTTEPNLHSFSTTYQNKPYYLNTSPEFAMKRLLVEFKQPIFQICKSFRVDEFGPNHNPEFSMLEWYQPGYDLSQLMDELEQLLNVLFTQKVVVQRSSYQEVFEKHAGFNPHQVTATACKQSALDHNIDIPVGLDDEIDAWLDWLLTQLVLPAMSQKQFTYIYDYPKTQCALAKLQKNSQGEVVAARFELFYGEIELANGFDELNDADEQAQRFNNEIQLRRQQGLQLPEVDKRFLAALKNGLPDCAGVAVGIDRILMLITNKKNVSDVLSYSWRLC